MIVRTNSILSPPLLLPSGASSRQIPDGPGDWQSSASILTSVHEHRTRRFRVYSDSDSAPFGIVASPASGKVCFPVDSGVE